MSSKYKYLDISVTVVNEDRPSATYSTAGAPAVQLPALSEVAAHFTSLSDGYLMWGASTKRAFSYFILDGAEGHPVLMVTLLMDRDVLLAGRPIVNLLAAVKSRAIEGEELTPDLLDRLVGESGFPEEPLRGSEESEGSVEATGVCMRSYSSPTELSNIFGFPRQKAYETYRGVVVVPVTEQMLESDPLPVVTSPLDKALMVVCPEGVESSAERVSFSDHLTVTYLAEGFDPVSVKFEVGTTNRYVRINGPALVVNSARHAGVVFRRRVPYTVTTQNGTPIDTYTILIDERTANRTEDGFEISNMDFREGKVKITVSSTNFSTYTQEFTPETLAEAIPLDIVLQPDSKDIVLRLDFGDGRVVEESLNIEKNTPEYCQLRAGRFHGFRAHRLMGSTPETYNVDVKPMVAASSPRQEPVIPSAPFAEKEAPRQKFQEQTLPLEEPEESKAEEAEKTTTGPVAPAIEKAPSAIRVERKQEIKAPEFTNETRGEVVEEEDHTKPDYMRYAVIGVIVVAVAALAWWLLGGSGSDSNAESAAADTTGVVAENAAATGTPGAVSVSAPTHEEQHDIDYMNSTAKWTVSQIKSEKYRALTEALSEGDIDAVIGNDYYAIKDRATNSDAVKVVDFLWRAKGTAQEKAHRKVLKQECGKTVIDMHRVMDQLSRRMPPADEENKAVRPVQ